MSRVISLKGCFPPIPTPFDEQGRVDHDHLASNLERWQKTPLRGFAVLGSNGEAVMLREAEKLEVWKTAREAIDGDHLFMAGTGCESTVETVELTEKAADLGADVALIVTPHYYKSRMDRRALVTYYTTIANGSPIPVVLYNVPAATGLDMGADVIIELSAHPNIIGLKESSGSVVKIGQVVAGAPEDFQVLAGSGSFLLPTLSVGGVGGVMALASVAPHELNEVVTSFETGDLTKAKDIQVRLIAPNAAVTSGFGVAGLKAALDLIGMYGGVPRPPLLPLLPPQHEELKRIMGEAGLL